MGYSLWIYTKDRQSYVLPLTVINGKSKRCGKISAAILCSEAMENAVSPSDLDFGHPPMFSSNTTFSPSLS
jgi:hypothetical protein